MSKHTAGYQLIDSGNFEKLEQVGDFRLVRPSLQAVWNRKLSASEWKNPHARFERNSTGSGKWYSASGLPADWTIQHADLSYKIKLTGFGHIGLFPEHFLMMNWCSQRIQTSAKAPEVLNLFAYTGALTLSCARAGANVTHVDAARGVVEWAKENALLSGLKNPSIRWIVDDVQKFVKREIKRNKTYDAIILDPPSFGRGTNNEIWKIEDHLTDLLKDLGCLFSDNFQFMILSGHTPGYTPVALENLLKEILKEKGRYEAAEMLIHEEKSGRSLPSGAFCRWASV